MPTNHLKISLLSSIRGFKNKIYLRKKVVNYDKLKKINLKVNKVFRKKDYLLLFKMEDWQLLKEH